MSHIFLASPHMSDEGYEKEYIQEAFDTNWIAPLGKNVNEFENEMKSKLGAKTSVALSCGTAAIHMALKSVGIKQGDLVFCQSLTFSASANPITYEKAIPVFIDSDESWNMSPKALREAFEKYKNNLPKAVIVVHLYGLTAKIEEIKSICNEYDIPLIEDAAESLGTTVNGKYTGTFGDYGIISFNGNKIITSSGGGMLLFNTDDAKEKASKVLFWSTQARENARHYEHKEIGYNYRMSNVVAGIGRGQLKVLDQRVSKKRYIYEYYQRELSELKGLTLMPRDLYNSYSNCWLTTIQLDDNCKVKPLDIMIALEENDIESRPVWKPMHMQPVFSECDYIDDNQTSQRLFEHGVCLPSDTKMTDEDLERICSIIKGLWNHV
ncbi:aminotransferase class V-fold PLP-dependent enzyme [Candidatus Stoquefichus massiliensis]|uniref:aminotransferase class V-fold PLP-dependent enzyme n=1 Tax=Candidatus Stoquefichus massiliensis TaxID=1470350 RepID=UPI0004BB6379|nr:aminotransferase class V-fold PLP-dependent enzyme [Candidatus Stoquefichus massiliensis]